MADLLVGEYLLGFEGDGWALYERVVCPERDASPADLLNRKSA